MRPRLTQSWAWPESEPSLATLGPHLGQTCSRLGHHCRVPKPRQTLAFVAESVVFVFPYLRDLPSARKNHLLKAAPRERKVCISPLPCERKRLSTEASPWNANHISFLGGGWAPSKVAGMEFGFAILATAGVLVGALGRHFDSLGTPLGCLPRSFGYFRCSNECIGNLFVRPPWKPELIGHPLKHIYFSPKGT